MTYEVDWQPAAEAQWKRLPSLDVQERIARAVHDFAATGAGRIERLAGGRLRLRVAECDAVIRIDAGVVHVLAVYGSR